MAPDELATTTVTEAARAAWTRHLGAAPAADLRDQLARGTVAGTAHETALRHPSRPALRIDGAELTHGELDDRAGRMAGWLSGRGVQTGDVVLISSPSSLSLVVAYLGTLRLGATVLLANPAYTEAELDHLSRDSGARMALATGTGLERLHHLAAPRSALREVADLHALAPAGSASHGALAGAPCLEPVPQDRTRAALLAYTSGTTGKPKAVPLTDANLLASIRAAMLAWRWHQDEVLVHSLPLFHQHGLSGVHATLLAGSRAIIRSRFDPEALLTDIGAMGASVLLGVPSIYARLAEADRLDVSPLRSLRLIVSGSAPLSPVLFDRISDLAGQPPLERYGSTESGLNVSNPYEGGRIPGTVGLALPGIELAIADSAGHPVSTGEPGEVVVRGPQVFNGYRGNPEATSQAFHPGGWFRSGDVGQIDPITGHLRLTGRLRELIISGGMNVYPREVEFVLESHPGVARAAVVGVASPRWGEEVVAAVVPAGDGGTVEPEALLEFVRSQLAAYKCPKRIRIVPELPVNAMGKVVADQLRELL